MNKFSILECCVLLMTVEVSTAPNNEYNMRAPICPNESKTPDEISSGIPKVTSDAVSMLIGVREIEIEPKIKSVSSGRCAVDLD
mmetsp:Transcript_1198/g.1544  ORF Transcript_1198/g.1544 Transcript_1198/m.1544 type:complete len:84 (+) Transcript_1198:447-698(+)